ncbi:MAG TPA: class I SAM-dependent methyltransferase [Niastella sp.]
MSNTKPLSSEIYSNAGFAQQYAQNIIDNAWNAYYERPASLSLLPADLQGKTILDAGCGPGITTAYFLDRGALVTGIDYSEEMLSIARTRTEGKATLMRHDLNLELNMFEASSFDIIYCSLVIHYIDDLDLLFKEFSRVLRPGGIVVFSTDHPEASFVKAIPVTGREKKSFFWDGYGIYMDTYMRPWRQITESLEANQLDIEKTIDPVPTEDCRVKFPDIYERLIANPNFICVKAINTKVIV